MGTNIRIILGDITKQKVDCIVNAANNSLLGGGGVDGAIHYAAGPELYKECLLLNGCETGQAKITKGYKLPAKYIIHTVGPIYDQERCFDCANQLYMCYKNCLDLAQENNIHTIVFPSISTGIYNFPVVAASKIAISCINSWLEKHANYDLKVTFCCFKKDTFEVYKKCLESRQGAFFKL